MKSKDTEKCMTQLPSLNRKIIQTSVFRKLYRKVKIKGKSETDIPNDLVNLRKLIQRMSLSIKEEEQLSEFAVLYEKAAKGYKEKDAGKAATRGVLCKGPGTRIHVFEIFSKFKYFGNILSMLHEE